jgi:DNA-binding Lrp family transcriptional regulator
MRMVVSYTLARVIPTHDKDVYEKVSVLDEVKGVVLSYGVYDMMITIETENIEELDNLVFNEIRKIEGIVSTTTLIGAGKKE